MIEVTNTYGKRVFLAESAIAELIDSGDSSKWHGINAYIRTFDGRTIEIKDTVESVMRAINKERSHE